MRSLHFLRAGIGIRAVAPVSRRLIGWLAAFFRRRAVQIAELLNWLLRFGSRREPVGHAAELIEIASQFACFRYF